MFDCLLQYFAFRKQTQKSQHPGESKPGESSQSPGQPMSALNEFEANKCENKSAQMDTSLQSLHYRHSQSGDVYAISPKGKQSNPIQPAETEYSHIGEPDIVRCSKPSIEVRETYNNLSLSDDQKKVQQNSNTPEIPENAGCAHSNSDVAANTNEEGEMEDYYSVDQPTDQNQVQEAERFQLGAHQNLNILQSGTGETYSQPAGIHAGEDYDYAYGHVPPSGLVSAHETPQLDSSNGEMYAEIEVRDAHKAKPPEEDDETMMQENAMYG